MADSYDRRTWVIVLAVIAVCLGWGAALFVVMARADDRVSYAAGWEDGRGLIDRASCDERAAVGTPLLHWDGPLDLDQWRAGCHAQADRGAARAAEREAEIRRHGIDPRDAGPPGPPGPASPLPSPP